VKRGGEGGSTPACTWPTSTPARGASAQILASYLRGVPGVESIETDAVAAHFGPETSGADIREIVRRTVLSTGAVTQAELISTVQSGRFKPQLPQGNYL